MQNQEIPKTKPSTLSKHILSTTTARISSLIVKRVKIPVTEEDIKDQRAFARKISEQYPGAVISGGRLKNGSVEISIRQDFGDTFTVYQMDDAFHAVENALVKGEITKTEHTIHQLPVYTSKRPAQGIRQEITSYIYATPVNELLVATTLEGLKQMVGAGNGEIPSMLENEIYSGLPEIISEMPVRWNISLLRAATLEKRKELELRNASEEELLQLDENEASGPLYQFSHREIDIAGLKTIETTIYASREDARNAYESRQTASPFSNQPVTGFNYLQKIEALKLEKSTWKLDGNMIVKTTIIDDEYYRQLIDYTKSYHKFMKELDQIQSADKLKEK